MSSLTQNVRCLVLGLKNSLKIIFFTKLQLQHNNVQCGKLSFNSTSFKYDINYIYAFQFLRTVSYLTKLRISVHPLYVETGRYCNSAIPRANRFCFHCKNILEDEKHFLLDCPLYKYVRKKYSKLLDNNILTC